MKSVGTPKYAHLAVAQLLTTNVTCVLVLAVHASTWCSSCAGVGAQASVHRLLNVARSYAQNMNVLNNRNNSRRITRGDSLAVQTTPDETTPLSQEGCPPCTSNPGKHSNSQLSRCCSRSCTPHVPRRPLYGIGIGRVKHPSANQHQINLCSAGAIRGWVNAGWVLTGARRLGLQRDAALCPVDETTVNELPSLTDNGERLQFG